MKTIRELTDRILKFRNERDWQQFHTPKDMVISLMLEVAELAEHCQWKRDEEFSSYLNDHREEIGDELADILYWVALISADFNIDLESHFEKKMEKNEKKYPVEKSKGSSAKYNKSV